MEFLKKQNGWALIRAWVVNRDNTVIKNEEGDDIHLANKYFYIKLCMVEDVWNY